MSISPRHLLTIPVVQSQKLTENLAKEHDTRLVDSVKDAAAHLKVTSDPLYIQSVCANELIYRTIQHSTLYYACRSPSELDSFHWEIDAKDRRRTPNEELWSSLVGAVLQSKASKAPFMQLEAGDYSYFKRHMESLPSTPQYLVPLVGKHEPFEYINLNSIWGEDRQFVNSEHSLGVQLVDMLVTTLRRAMVQNLQAAMSQRSLDRTKGE